MADTVANKKSFNEKFNNFKTKTKTTFNNAKTKVSDYNSAVKQAYRIGWNAGYEAQKKIPDKFGTRLVATSGFNSGFKNGQKQRKYTGK